MICVVVANGISIEAEPADQTLRWVGGSSLEKGSAMTRPRETPLYRGHILVPSTLLLGALLTAGILAEHESAPLPARAQREPINGAHQALSDWGASRSYPGSDIPAAGFSRAYEYSVAELRRPLSETFGGGEHGELRLGQGSGWQPIGPTNGGGRTLTIAFDPVDPDTIYAGAASGGLWRSDTGGVGAAAWERVPTGFPELGVSTIAFEPGNSDVFYIGTGESPKPQNPNLIRYEY